MKDGFIVEVALILVIIGVTVMTVTGIIDAVEVLR